MFDEKFWVALSFVLFVAIIYKKLSNIAATGLDKKTSDIEEQLKKASLIKKEAQEIRDNYLKQKKESIVKAQTLIDNAEKEAKRLISENNKELKRIVSQKNMQADSLIIEIENQTLNKLRKTAIDQGVEKFKTFIKGSSSEQTFYESSLKTIKNLN